MTLSLVTGLAAEARIGSRIGRARAGGGAPWGAEVAAEKLIGDGATALLSFGLCGGLDPKLLPGDIVLPVLVAETGASYPTDPGLAARFGAPAGRLFASDTIIVSQEAKRRLFELTRAVAVDCESGAVARVAARHGLPFAVLRAVCDPAETTLPPAALVALDHSGRTRLRQVIGAVARRPGQVADLIRLARHAAAGRRSLVRIADAFARRSPSPAV